jgi:predicted phosphodiesterase
MSKVFVIGDLHFPYASKKALDQVYKKIKSSKPNVVIQIGDLLDQYSFSKYARSVNLTTPKQELDNGLKQAREFWAKVHKLVPKAKKIQLLGNHDVRIRKRMLSQFPEMESLYSFTQQYTFPNVKTCKSDRDFVKIDGVVYCHGWYSKSIKHANHFNSPVVHGHLHAPGVTTEGRLWAMDVGYLADPKQLPMQYTASKYSHWRHACGIVNKGLPTLVLL